MSTTPLRCIVCPNPITGAHLRLTWEGLETSRTLNGTTMYAHFMCVLLQRQPGGEPLPERIHDPDPMVHVEPEYDSGQWTATCQVHGNVAQKDIREDAELGAARHLVRKHSTCEHGNEGWCGSCDALAERGVLA